MHMCGNVNSVQLAKFFCWDFDEDDWQNSHLRPLATCESSVSVLELFLDSILFLILRGMPRCCATLHWWRGRLWFGPLVLVQLWSRD
jgi:hypothetical protein